MLLFQLIFVSYGVEYYSGSWKRIGIFGFWGGDDKFEGRTMNEFFGICIRKQLYTHVHSHTNRMLAITRHTQKEHIQISMDLIRPTFLYRVASLTIFTCLYCTKVSLDHFVIFLLLLVIDIHTLYCIYVYK